MISLGSRIRKLREEQGLSRATLAQMCGVSERALQNIEINKADLRVGTLEKVAQALGVNLAHLVTEKNA